MRSLVAEQAEHVVVISGMHYVQPIEAGAEFDADFQPGPTFEIACVQAAD